MADEAELAARANAPPTPPYRHKTRIVIPDDDSGDESPREMAPPMDEAFGVSKSAHSFWFEQRHM